MEATFVALLFKRWQRSTNLSPEDKVAIAELPWAIRKFNRDAYLVREGEPSRHCFLLCDGFAFRQKLVGDGSRQIISIHIPGEFLDLQNCLLDVADHSVQSLGPSTVATLPRNALTEMMERYQSVRRAMWLDTLIDASIFREWVVNVGRRDARERIAHLLCELVMRMKAAGLGEGRRIHFPLTQEQIADCTGLTPVHTNRTLQILRKLSLISLSDGSLTILDWDGLKAIGDFNQRYLHHSV